MVTQSHALTVAGSFFMGSLVAVAFFTFIFFLFGPEIAAFIPRCMAGTLLLHIGLDLFLEGVVDSYDSYDSLVSCDMENINKTRTAMHSAS